MLSEIGKTLTILGAGIVVLGGLLWLSSGTLKNFPLGRLPGNILIQKDNFSFYLPLTTSILISFSLSAVIWLWQIITR